MYSTQIHGTVQSPSTWYESPHEITSQSRTRIPPSPTIRIPHLFRSKPVCVLRSELCPPQRSTRLQYISAELGPSESGIRLDGPNLPVYLVDIGDQSLDKHSVQLDIVW